MLLELAVCKSLAICQHAVADLLLHESCRVLRATAMVLEFIAALHDCN